MGHMRNFIGNLFSISPSVLMLALTLVFTVFLHSPAQANPKYASFVMDADTGMVLHQRYANKRLHPASLTKVMTLLMVFEGLEKGTIRLNDRIYISNHAASMVPSKLGLPAGSSIRVRDAISILVTKSANDIAVAVGEHIAGTERGFAYAMTRRAKDIGMTRTVFMNASGLHNKRQVSTARDMAKMAYYVIQKYPRYYKYFSQTKFNYRGKSYRGHNRLMETYPGMDGMKTGYVNASGFNLIASAVRDNRRIIGVVFGGKTSRSRNAHMAQLLDQSFAKIADVRVASARIPSPGRKPQAIMQLASLNSIETAAGNSSRGVRDMPAVLPAPVIAEQLMNDNLAGQPTLWASLKADTDDMVLPMAEKPAVVTKAALVNVPVAARDIIQGGHKPAINTDGWAIQVGAFQTKAQSAAALKNAIQTLPQYYAQANPVITPLETAHRKIYRARLSGYSSHDAYAACAYIEECITIAP